MPGNLPLEAALAVLNALPLDLTYIDGNDIIRYFSDFRIFKRQPEILGTRVQDCHKPESRPQVNEVIDELKSGRKEVSEFWIDFKGRKVHIRYFAVRDRAGKYMGLVEIGEARNALE